MIQDEFLFDADCFMRTKAQPLDLTDQMMNGAFYKALTAATNVCFVGDSLTEGTLNGGVPWYEPIENLIRGKVLNRSFGGCTSKMLLFDLKDMIVNADADLFVVAIGANDIYYRDPHVCSMNADEYVETLSTLRTAIVAKNPAAKFIFIAPWTSTDGDANSNVDYPSKRSMYADYSAALKQWCAQNNDLYINANDFIETRLKTQPQSDYLIDFIHPNATAGVQLYCEAALLSE